MVKPEQVSSGGKRVTAVTSATRIRFALGETIYIVWVLGKEVKNTFFSPKKICGQMVKRYIMLLLLCVCFYQN